MSGEVEAGGWAKGFSQRESVELWKHDKERGHTTETLKHVKRAQNNKLSVRAKWAQYRALSFQAHE